MKKVLHNRTFCNLNIDEALSCSNIVNSSITNENLAGSQFNLYKFFVLFFFGVIFFCLGNSNKSFGQTTVFSDNFNTGTLNAAYTILHEPAGSESFSDNGAVLNGVSNGTKGCAYVVAPLSAFSAPYSSTLNTNPGLVTWSFNMSATTASTNGVFGLATNFKAIGVILVSTSTTNLTTTGNGYAIINTGNSSSEGWDFVKFTNGIGGTTTTLAELTAPSSAKTWVDIKVTYNPSTGVWTYYLNDESNKNATPTNNPATFAYVNSLTSTDATYTGVAMSSFAFAMSNSSTSGDNYLYDNFTCTVVNACSATITGQPISPAAICGGAGTVSFAVTATGGTTYQWQENAGTGFANITNGGVYSNATTAALTLTNPSAIMNGYAYRVVVNGCITSDGTSLLTVNSPPAIITQPASPAAVCSGAGVAAFTVAATGAGLTYQWQESTTGSGGTFLNVTNGGVYSNATTATLTLTNATAAMSGYAYRVVVSGTCASPATSNGTALLSFVTAPVITAQPATPATVCAGSGTSSFTVTASGGDTFTYIWKESTDHGATFPTTLSNSGVYSGTNTAILTITSPTLGMNGNQYEVVVTNCSGSITTNGAATLNVGSGASITGQPANSTEAPGGSTNFTVTATGTSYQWQYSNTGVAGTFSNVANGTPANFSYTNGTPATLTVATTTAAAASTLTLYYYQCIVSSASCSATSSAANLEVLNPSPTTVSISPGSVTEGNGAFTLTVNGTNFVNGTSVIDWNGTALATIWVSATQMTATVPAANVAVGKGGTTPSITVVTSGSVTPTSNAQTFTINAVGTSRICTASSPWIFTIDNTGTNAGTNFTSFTAAITDLNTTPCASIRNHPITFKVRAGQTFNETTPAIIVAPAASTADYVLFEIDSSFGTTHPIIKAAAGTSGSTDAIVTIQGTNYIIFNGIDLNVSDNTMDIGYYLRTNTNSSSATIGAQNNTIENCIVTMNSSDAKATYGVFQTGAGGTANIGNTYNNVTVYNSFYGIVLSGNSSTLDNSNTVQNCTIGPASSGANNIGGSLSSQDYGIGALNQNGVTIDNNTIENLSLSAGKELDGIFVTGSGTGTESIYLNKIHDINGTSTSSSNSVYGIHVEPTGNSITNIFSNCVSGINAAASTSSRVVAGINFDSQGSSGNNTIGYVLFNSIWLSGSYAAGVADFYTDGASTSLNIKENIFKYSGTQVNSSNKAYCIYLNKGATVLSTEDYNIYDMVAFSSPYFTGNSSGDVGILTAWKTATGKDVKSQQFFTQFVSTSDLHLSDYPSTSYTGLASDTSLISPSADIDGQARTTPTIGADEVPVTTAPIVVISAPNQPAPANIAKGNPGQVIGQYNLAPFAATTGANAQPIFTGLTLTVRTVAPMAANTDFSNFKLVLYDASTFSTIGTIGTYTSTLSFNAFGDATIPFNFTPGGYDMSGGDTYYLYVSCDISASAGNGSNIEVDSSFASNFTFTPDAGIVPVTKIAPTVIDTAGRQTICTFYYNTATLDAFNILNNPGLITTNVDNLNAWRVKKVNDNAGMGGEPSDFVSDFQVFNIIMNGGTFSTPAANWILSGSFSKAIVGDGINYITFIVPAGNVITDTVDVMAHGTLQLFPTPVVSSSLTLGNLADSSTVEFSSASSQTIPLANYGNLKLDGSGARVFTSGTTGIKDSFELQTYTALSITTTGSTINFNGGTMAQVIPGNNHNNLIYYNLAVNNTSGNTTFTGENTALAENIIVSDSLVANKPLLVPAMDSIILQTSVKAVVANTASLFQVNGAIINNVIGSIFTTSSSTLQFNKNSIFRLASADATNGSTSTPAQIPIANWKGGSNCILTGIIGTAGNDYVGLDGNYQAFGDFIINCPDMIGKLLLTNATFGGFSADTLNVENTGSRGVGHTGYVQVPRQKSQETVNVGKYIQHSGYVTVAQAISGGGSRVLNVAGDFTVKDSINSIYPSKFELMNTTGSTQWYGKLAVGGNFFMDPTATLVGTLIGSSQTADLSFNGSAGNQNATFGIVTGNVNFEVNKTQVAGGSDTVKLLTNVASDSFYLTKGVFSIGANTLTVNGPVAYTNSPGTGTFAGSTSSTLMIGSSPSFTATAAGTLMFANNTAGSPYNNYLKNFTLFNNATATLGNALNIDGGTSATPGVVSVGSSTTGLTTAGFLTLKSFATGTARVDINSTGSTTYISGGVTIERYIQGFRAWRLLTSPTNPLATSQTINASWQEGQHNNISTPPLSNTNPGYGTEITNTIATSPAATGFDQAVTNNPSIMYLSSTPAWVTPANTNTVTVNSQQGFMLFVRGDRSVQVTTPPFKPAVQTTLRTIGTLNQGNKTVNSAIVGFGVVGNPFASEISLDNIFANYKSTIVGGSYYAWDPTLSEGLGVGAFGTFLYNSAGNYSHTTLPPTSLLVPGKMESGAAFAFNFIGTGNAMIQEADKTTASALVFRPSDDTVEHSFRGDVYGVNPDGSTDLDDGTLTLYSSEYSDSVNWLEDAKKLGNPGVNLALERDGKLLAIEKRQPIVVTDTIFFSITNMSQQTYQFRFAPANLIQPGLIALLEDKFLNTITPVSLTDTTKINFNVTSNPASQGGNRFIVVFLTPGGGPLPVTFTNIKASQQSNNIAVVQWNVTNELNIKDYVVEKSTDGKNFSEVGIVSATGSSQYNWLDIHAVTGENYYRIKSIGNDGAIAYTQIVKVKIGLTNDPQIAVYPNPVKDGMLGLQFTNMPAGTYQLHLTNTLGQELLSKSIQHQGGSATQTVQITRSAAKEIYTLEVINPDGSKTSFKVLTQ